MAGVMFGMPAIIAPELPAAPLTDGDQIAATFGVTVVWDTTFCKMGAHPEIVLGCVHPATPDTIYIDPESSPRTAHRTVLHELGHIMQYRLGLDLDECNADKFADSLQPPHKGFNCYLRQSN